MSALDAHEVVVMLIGDKILDQLESLCGKTEKTKQEGSD